MRSSGRNSIKALKVVLSTGALGAAIIGGLIMSANSAIMNDLLEHWNQTDREIVASKPKMARANNLAKPNIVRTFASVAKVKDAFTSAGYELDAVRWGQVAVPRVLLASLPYDLPQMRQAQDRKTVFLRYMLPYVLAANNRVLHQRERMLYLRAKVEKGHRLGEKEAIWFTALYKEYRAKPGDFEALLLRVDTVPVSLALAQAAVESGWGTSRFAQEGNAPFGQWTSNAYAGLVPKERKAGMTHKVRSFDSLKLSAESYLRNLNTHRAYKGLRQMRDAFRKEDKPIDSIAIAGTLLKYSEKGMEYVNLLRHIIKKNDLIALDSAKLGEAILDFRPGA